MFVASGAVKDAFLMGKILLQHISLVHTKKAYASYRACEKSFGLVFFHTRLLY